MDRPRRKQPPADRRRQDHSRAERLRSWRERMLDAMIDTVAERGYHQTILSDVAARAGVGRDTLRQQFGDKQGLFIAAHDWLLRRLAIHVAPGYQQPGPWPERISRALSALLTAIAYRPQGARMAIIDVLAAGPQAHQHHLTAIETLTNYIDPGRHEIPNRHQLPPTIARIVAGGIAARIHKHVATSHTSVSSRAMGSAPSAPCGRGSRASRGESNPRSEAGRSACGSTPARSPLATAAGIRRS
jgi:AcrR family transcriptional regulator